MEVMLDERPRPLVLVLDLDGPILDVAERYHAAHLRALAAVGDPGAPLDAGELWRAKRRRAGAWELLVVGERETRYLEAFKAAIEREELLKLDRLQPGALEALLSLRQLCDVRVVSLRTNQEGARRCVERLGITEAVPVEFVSHGPDGKSTRVAEIAANRQVLAVVGDSEADADAAARIRAPFVGVSCGIREPRLLKAAGAGLVVTDLSAVAKALEQGSEAFSKLAPPR